MAIELDSYGFRDGSNNSIIAAKGQLWFESATNQMVMDIVGCAAGYASNIRRDVSEKTGWAILGRSESTERKPVARKSKGFLPKRVENWAIGKLGLDVADGDLLPDGFGADDFLSLPDVEQETVNYQRLLSKLCPDNEAPALRAWLGCGLTIAEREQEKLEALTKGVNGKIGKALKTALSHAESLESPEMALAIAALMSRFGFQTETETE